MFMSLPNWNIFRSLSLCLRNPCEFREQCRNVHCDICNHFNNHYSSIYGLCRRAPESLGPVQQWSQFSPSQTEQRREENERSAIETKWKLGLKEKFYGSNNFYVNETNKCNYYEYFYNNFLSIVNKSITEVYRDRKVNTEVVNEFTKEMEKIYYKNCLKLEEKDDSKIVSDDFVVYSANSRSLNNKKCSVEEIFAAKNIDFGIISEVNSKNPPRIKGYHRFNCLSDKKFHGTVMYVNNRYKGTVAKIPDEQFEDEMIHVIMKSVTPAMNIIGVYLEIERDRERTERVWRHLTVKLDSILERGESFVLVGDMNRPLDTIRKSYGTKLLEDWLKNEKVELLNDVNTPTRYDPVTGKGSVLDLGIISSNISNNVRNFEIDSHKNWTPFSLKKIGVDHYDRKPSDHCAFMVTLKVNSIKRQEKKIPMINYKNPKGWERYKDVSDRYANKIMEAIRVEEDIDRLERKLEIINLDILVDSFGIIWQFQGKSKKQKKRDSKQIKEIYQQQQEELDEMLSQGYNKKDMNAKIYKLEQMITGPKIQAAESMCIKDPKSGELITDYETIKETYLEHTTKILSKNQLREEDKNEYEEKIRNHNRIMEEKNANDGN